MSQWNTHITDCLLMMLLIRVCKNKCWVPYSVPVNRMVTAGWMIGKDAGAHCSIRPRSAREPPHPFLPVLVKKIDKMFLFECFWSSCDSWSQNQTQKATDLWVGWDPEPQFGSRVQTVVWPYESCSLDGNGNWCHWTDISGPCTECTPTLRLAGTGKP